MRYLKRYESLLSLKDVKLDIEDILLELKDINFWTNTEIKSNILFITIGRLRSQKGFIKSEEELKFLKSTFIRIRDYAKLNNLKLDKHVFDTFFKKIMKGIEEFNKFMDDNRFTIILNLHLR